MHYPATLNQALHAQQDSDVTVTFIDGVAQETTFTYAQLYHRARQYLYLLQQNGWQAGDTVIFLLNQNASFVTAFWACLLGGMIPVPVAMGISEQHRAKFIRIFQHLSQPGILLDQAAAEAIQKYAESQLSPELYAEIAAASLVWETLQPTAQLGEEYPATAEELAFIQFSSGSTREPKGVCMTHANLLATIMDTNYRTKVDQQDIALSWMPLTHDMGLIGFHLNPLVSDIPHYIMATDLFSRRPLLWLQLASEKRASILNSPNFGYKHYLKQYRSRDPGELDLAAVRLIYNGAEPISVSLCNEFMETMQAHGLRPEAMYTVYGLAEAGLAVSLPEPGQPFASVWLQRDKLGMGDKVSYQAANSPNSICCAVEGSPVAQCQVRIANASGDDCGEDTVGEIQLKGPNVTAGYYRDAAATAALFTSDGWLRTGDLGLFYQGQLVVTGRLKDIIFVHGQNYYPHDLEALVLDSDKQFELGKVVAVGARQPAAIQDDILVFILYRGELAEFAVIVQQLKRLFSQQMGLEITHVLPVSRIPKTTSGKVQRHQLAAAYTAGEFAETIAGLAALLLDTTTKQANAAADTELTGYLQNLLATALAGKTVGLDDDLFALGLSSLQLVEIYQQLTERYPDKEMSITDLFEYDTVNKLADYLVNSEK